KRIPCAPVLTVNEAMAHPHLRQRGTVRQVDDKILGKFDIPGLPVRFSRWKLNAELHADVLGEHNDEILREFLNLPDEEIANLYRERVLVQDRLLAKRHRNEAEAT